MYTEAGEKRGSNFCRVQDKENQKAVLHFSGHLLHNACCKPMNSLASDMLFYFIVKDWVTEAEAQ